MLFLIKMTIRSIWRLRNSLYLEFRDSTDRFLYFEHFSIEIYQNFKKIIDFFIVRNEFEKVWHILLK